MVMIVAACGETSSGVVSGATSTTATPPTTADPAPVIVSTTTAPATESTTTAPVIVSTTALAPDSTVAPLVPDLELPKLVMVDGDTVRSVGPDDNGTMVSDVELVADAPVRVAFMASDLTVITEEHPDPTGSGRVVRYGPDGTREAIPGIDRLFGLEVINGEESMIAAQDRPTVTGSGDIVAIGIKTGTVVSLGTAWGPAYGVGSVEWSDFGTAVVSAEFDLTELVSYIDDTGREVIQRSPTDDLPYGEPPLVKAAALSPDGSLVVWAEGPDQVHDDSTGEFTLLGDSWVVKGMNLDTGRVEFAMPIDFAEVDPHDSAVDSIRFAPTFLVVNRTRVVGDGVINLAPVMIDMTGAEPATVPFDEVGNATLFPA